MRKVFVSDDAKKMGRGRAKRILEAILDRSSPSEPLCTHNDYCSLRMSKNKKKCYLSDNKDCRTFKFYEKYGRNWNHLGIGS